MTFDLWQSARTISADTNLAAEFGHLPAPEIFGDRQILALNPATNNLVAPARFLQHPLVHQRFFYTLPRPLWNAVVSEIGTAVFCAGAMEMEATLSEICGEHCWNAGLWNGRAIPFRFLRTAPVFRPSAAEANEIGFNVNQAQLDNMMRIAEERIQSFGRTTRAYLGWLLVNTQFMEEHDALLSRFQAEIRTVGFSRIAATAVPVTFPAATSVATTASNCQSAFAEFFARWRLMSLAGPYLPEPLEPQMSGMLAACIRERFSRARGEFCLPDIYSIPSRDELRNQLDDALHGSEPPEHLADWIRLVSRRTPDRKRLRQFSRLFEVQHYWRILRTRHAAAMHRKQGAAKRAIANYLGVSFDTIHCDLLYIARQRGRGWDSARCPFEFGPF